MFRDTGYLFEHRIFASQLCATFVISNNKLGMTNGLLDAERGIYSAPV